MFVMQSGFWLGSKGKPQRNANGRARADAQGKIVQRNANSDTKSNANASPYGHTNHRSVLW